jgi:hypothetical protein
MADPEAGDRAASGYPVGDDHVEGDVLPAAALDRAPGTVRRSPAKDSVYACSRTRAGGSRIPRNRPGVALERGSRESSTSDRSDPNSSLTRWRQGIDPGGRGNARKPLDRRAANPRFHY